RQTLVVHRPRESTRTAIEKSYQAQERVIQAMGPTCAQVCVRHLGDAATCTQHRRHQLYADLGRERFWNGRMAAARAAFREAIRVRSAEPLAYGHHAASHLGRLLEPVFRARQAFQANRRTKEECTARDEAADLLHATAYRHTRRTIIRKIHAVDDVMSRLGR